MTNIKPCEDPSPSVSQRETYALGLVLQTPTAEWTACLLAAALLLLRGGADVSQGLPGQRPKRSAYQHFDLERALNLSVS